MQNQLSTKEERFALMQEGGVGHGGWSQREQELLRSETRQASASGKPLRFAFEMVAQKTGRKPNSIRNYYYTALRPSEGKANGRAAFRPFTQNECRQLLRQVLSAQAAGISVRKCTMEMGDGDRAAMLRYQNKYRSLLRTHPALVEEVMGELHEKGIDCKLPPFAQRKKSAGEYDVQLEGIISHLSAIDDGALMPLIPALYRLAHLAARTSAAERKREEHDALAARYDWMAIRLQKSEDSLERAQERIEELESALEALKEAHKLNEAFLSMSPGERKMQLSKYVASLSAHLENAVPAALQ